MTNTAAELRIKSASEVVAGKVSFVGKLEGTELLSGTPTVAEQGTSDLTLASPAVSTAALTISGATVAIGNAVTFTISGGTAGTTYTILVQCGTDASNTRNGRVKLKVIAD